MFSLLKSSKQPKIKPVVLLILDGWGLAPASEGNAISQAKTPNFDRYYSQYPHGELIASGESVGLPANEAGNSEVGHLTIGAGRAIHQSLPRINMAIKDGSFFENRAFMAALDHVRKHQSKLHILGLVSSGAVHSSTEHLYALLDFCRRDKLVGVNLHLFTDGRDAPPQDGLKVINEVEEKLEDIKVGRIATISGRYYAMDRDARWERTKKAYDAIVLGGGLQASSAQEAVKSAYARGQTDEFIKPTVIIEDNISSRLGPSSARLARTVDDGDGVIFFNFRIDRPRQLTMAFVFSDFEHLKSFEFGYLPHEWRKGGQEKAGTTFIRDKWPKGLFFATMTEYQKRLPVSAIAFPPGKVKDTLAEVLSARGLRQGHLAESEKERMVTFYFDGMREEKFQGEDVEIISSPAVSTYDKKPEMSVFKVVKRFEKLLKRGKYHFFVLNFANPDMVAHSGSLPATIKAVEATDKAIGKLVEAVKAEGGTVVLTSDHGNAEELLSFPSTSFFVTSSVGSINTEHSNNLVPIFIVGNALEGKAITLPKGDLTDVAPTILSIMGLPRPEAMTGRDLLESTQEQREQTGGRRKLSPV